VADGQGSGVDETDAGAATPLRVQIGDQRNENRGHQLDEAVIAHEGWELTVQVALYILGVIGFEGALVGLMEQDHDGHQFTWMQLRRAHALALPCGQQVLVPVRRKLLPKIVYGTKEFEHTHMWNLLGIDTDVRFVLSYQEWFPYPELTLVLMPY
jgi:hypothetical protein